MTPTNRDVDAALAGGELPLATDMRTRILSAIVSDGPEPAFTHHLAQMNIARFRHGMDHPDLAGFVEMLDPINHQADAAPGFVWRLTDPGSNNATSITFYDDPLMLVNLSVWTDIESLRTYVYRTGHASMVKRRREWADPLESRHLVLWWVPAGHIPDIAEGDAKLRRLDAEGPTPEAFTFGQHFPPPDHAGA